MSLFNYVPYNDADDKQADHNDYLYELTNGRYQFTNEQVDEIENEMRKYQDDVDECPPFEDVNYFKNLSDTYWVVTYFQNDNTEIVKNYSIYEYSLTRLRRMWDIKSELRGRMRYAERR